MDIEALQSQLSEALNAESVVLQLDGNRLTGTVVAACFAELSRVKRQQMVYAFLKEDIASGALHAVSIRAHAPDERG